MFVFHTTCWVFSLSLSLASRVSPYTSAAGMIEVVFRRLLFRKRSHRLAVPQTDTMQHLDLPFIRSRHRNRSYCELPELPNDDPMAVVKPHLGTAAQYVYGLT